MLLPLLLFLTRSAQEKMAAGRKDPFGQISVVDANGGQGQGEFDWLGGVVKTKKKASQALVDSKVTQVIDQRYVV